MTSSTDTGQAAVGTGRPAGPTHSETVRAQKRHISDMVVHVRFGLAVAVCGAVASVATLVLGVFTPLGWIDLLLLLLAVGLSALGAWEGVWGVIRYGLFTEGCGARQVADELHLSRYAYAAGITAQFSVMVAAVAAIVLLVRLIIG